MNLEGKWIKVVWLVTPDTWVFYMIDDICRYYVIHVTDQCAKCSISAVLYVIGNNEKMDWCYSDI